MRQNDLLAMNQWGFTALNWPVPLERRVRFILGEYVNGNAPRWVDLLIGSIVGAVIGAYAMWAIMTFSFSTRLNKVEESLRLHIAQPGGHSGQKP